MKNILISISLLIPFFIASYELFILQSVQDPIKYIYTTTGITATVLLFFSISISLFSKYINLTQYRKIIGLFGFFYAFLHFLNFYILDAELSFSFMINETLDKPFIYLGMLAFIILIFMTTTSSKKLFRKYNQYHKAIYISLFLITIHFIMAQKSLSIMQLFFIIIIVIIFFMKLVQYIIKKNNI